MSSCVASNDDEPCVICQTCKGEMKTDQLRCCNASLPEDNFSPPASSSPFTAIEDTPIPPAARRKPSPIKMLASEIDRSHVPCEVQKRPTDPVITKPRQTIWLDSPDSALKTLAELCSGNLPALLPQPDPIVAPILTEKIAAGKRAEAEQIKTRVLNAEKARAEQNKAAVECSKKMWEEVILEFTKIYSTQGLRAKCSYAKWKAECVKVLEGCKSRRAMTGWLEFYRSSFLSVRNTAVSYFGTEWTNRCIGVVNTKYQASFEHLRLTPLPKYVPKEVRFEPVPVRTRKPAPQAAELPWATPGSSLLVFFTDKWLKATFVAKVQSGYKFAFADNTNCIVTKADVLWRVMTFEQFATVQPPAVEPKPNKKRKLEIMIAEKEEMELQHAALKKRVATIELKMTEKKEMIAQLIVSL